MRRSKGKAMNPRDHLALRPIGANDFEAVFLNPQRRRQWAYTLIELLAVTSIVAFAVVAFRIVRPGYGFLPAVLASLLAASLGAMLVVFFYRWIWSRKRRLLLRLREEYQCVYRVKELPMDSGNIVKPVAAEIQIGDYGWDTRPKRRDGLVHLQGLTKKWQVVWHAGFTPAQIEKVAFKPVSQFDYWSPYWAKTTPPPTCPYTVRERSTPTMGLPHHSGHYFIDHPSEYYRSQTIPDLIN